MQPKPSPDCSRGAEVGAALSGAARVREAISTLRQGHSFSSAPKYVLLGTYFETGIEHHQAIEVLIRAELVGSALALVRPIAEACVRAHWLYACATDDQVQQICGGARRVFPAFEIMSAAIDAACGTTDVFSGFSQNAWGVMCDYAHGGTLQLGRRLTGNQLKPNYRDGEIIEVLNVATTALLMLARVVFIGLGLTRETDAAVRIAGEWATP